MIKIQLENLAQFPGLTVGDVIVKREKGQLCVYIPSPRMFFSKWSFRGINKDGHFIYSKMSKISKKN